ncbi:MAG: dTDP-glucose 4,6-dehydratase [Pirellulales bacterium]
MRILITGAAGFIGVNALRWLLRDTPDQLLAVDKMTYAVNQAMISELVDANRLRFAPIDLCDSAALFNCIEDFCPQAVIHLAAETHVDRSIDDPRPFLQSNIVGTFELLECVRRYWNRLPIDQRDQFRFLHVSTDEVYGSLAAASPPSTEQSVYQPRSPYSATKASSDHLALAWYSTFGLPVLVTHSSNNYGPYQFPEKLLPMATLRAIRGEPIPVYGHGENVRDWIHVDDHVRALYQVLLAGTPGQTYNVGAGNECRNIELVRKICDALDELYPGQQNPALPTEMRARPSFRYADLISFVTDRPGHDFRYALDTTKLRSELGWRPLEPLSEGIRSTVGWYLTHRDWWEGVSQAALARKGLGQALVSDEGRDSGSTGRDGRRSAL